MPKFLVTMKKPTNAKCKSSTRGLTAKRSSPKAIPSIPEAPTKATHATKAAGARRLAGGWDPALGAGEPDYGFSDPGPAPVAPWLRQFCYGSPSAAASANQTGKTRMIRRLSRSEMVGHVESAFRAANRALLSNLPRMIVCDKRPVARAMTERAARLGISIIQRPVSKPTHGDVLHTTTK
jgi:hypothetical protein